MMYKIEGEGVLPALLSLKTGLKEDLNRVEVLILATDTTSASCVHIIRG
jgi:hypothetical protein